LRPGQQRTAPPTNRVVPSSADGLHCGTSQRSRSTRSTPSSRPQRTGSIAARSGKPRWRWPTLVVPSSADGLHCGECPDHGPQCPGDVVPSSADGLHCGWTSSFRPASEATRSSRPQRTGSIAATTLTADSRRGAAGRPVLSGRAPLRHGRGW